MNLLEYEAKTLLRASHIPIPSGVIITKTSGKAAAYPLVLKSQVPTGGRGKAGGVVVVNSAEELTQATNNLFALDIKGHLPKSLLAEEKLSIARELYLSLLIDRKTAGMQLLAHIQGGVEVEGNKEFASWPVDYSKPDFDALGQELANYYDLAGQVFLLQDLVQNLVSCMKQNDATLIEINPLILTADKRLIAGDGKMTLDDAAAFRHPEWHFETKPTEANFVTIDPNGNVATIANGAGLAMATVDAAYDAGLTPANFLDIGGGANTESLLKAFHKIVEYPNVQAVIINVFAGITQADEVARAIVEAQKNMSNLPPLFIRLAGTNYKEAATILEAAHISIMPNLESCLKAAKGALHV